MRQAGLPAPERPDSFLGHGNSWLPPGLVARPCRTPRECEIVIGDWCGTVYCIWVYIYDSHIWDVYVYTYIWDIYVRCIYVYTTIPYVWVSWCPYTNANHSWHGYGLSCLSLPSHFLGQMKSKKPNVSGLTHPDDHEACGFWEHWQVCTVNLKVNRRPGVEITQGCYLVNSWFGISCFFWSSPNINHKSDGPCTSSFVSFF